MFCLYAARVQAITQLDVPLVTFMASMARALGLRNSLLPARSALMAKEARIPATFNSNGREFYENLLVPWFAATAAQAVVSIDGSAEGVEAGWEADTTAQSGLQELAQIHLTESGERLSRKRSLRSRLFTFSTLRLFLPQRVCRGTFRTCSKGNYFVEGLR